MPAAPGALPGSLHVASYPWIVMDRELRDLDETRIFMAQGLLLQRFRPPGPASVRPTLQWALEIAAEGNPLPPAGFLADFANIALGTDQMPRSGVLHGAWPGPGLMRAYEDFVLGKLLADASLERAGDVLRRYEGRDQARGLAYVLEQMRSRSGWGGVHLSPAALKTLQRDPPEQLLAVAAESLDAGGLQPLVVQLMEELIAAMRRAAELLGPEDLFELEHGTALEELGQRVALQQLLRGITMLDGLVPRVRPRPRAGRQEVPTRVIDEDTYPVGGFSSLSTRGTVESLLHSQLAYMEKDNRPDLFDIKFLRDELLYYARDENEFLRRRRTFVVALQPDLVDARVKDAELPYQRGVLLLAWIVVAVRRVLDWLSSDALTFVIAFVGDKDATLAPERSLLEMVFRDLIQNGTVALVALPAIRDLEEECKARARRSLCHVLVVSTADHPLKMEFAATTRLVAAGAVPQLRWDGEELTSSPDLDGWAALLQALLDAWV